MTIQAADFHLNLVGGLSFLFASFLRSGREFCCSMWWHHSRVMSNALLMWWCMALGVPGGFLWWLLEFCVLGWICNLNAFKVVGMYTFCVPNHVVRSGLDRVRLEDLCLSRLPGSGLTLGEEFGFSMWLTTMVSLCGLLFWCGGEVSGCLVIFCCGCLNFVCL